MNSVATKPIFVILAGPNGVGKTTGALSILPQELRIIHFVNADLIARGLSPLKPALADTVNEEKLDVFSLRPLRIPLRTLRLKKREFNRKAKKCKVRKVQFHAVLER